MTYLLALDTEQMEMLRISLLIPQAFLTARKERVDPEGMLTGAHEVQAGKITNLLSQAWRGPIPTFDKLSGPQRKTVLALAKTLAEAKEDHTRIVALDQMISHVLSAARPEDGQEPPATWPKEETEK